MVRMGDFFVASLKTIFNYFSPQNRPATFSSLFFLELLEDRISALESIFNRDATVSFIVHRLSELSIDMAQHIKVENQQII